MTGGGIDRRGPKDSENAHNSFLTKCTEKGFWIFATDIMNVFSRTFENIFSTIAGTAQEFSSLPKPTHSCCLKIVRKSDRQ